MPQQKVTPFLWFNNCAEEAASFYVSLFKDSRMTGRTPDQDGKTMIVEFQLGGVNYVAFNGGPHFVLNEAFSLSIACDTQEEIDEYWEKLTAGGQPVQCGWLKDRFGVSWQVAPSIMPQLLNDPDPAKSQRVMAALMQMIKLDLAALQRAHDGVSS